MKNHGHVSFSWEDELFVVHVEGAFNEEGVAHYVPLIQEAILNRDKVHWKRLEIWDDEALGSPDTLAAAKLIYDWYDDNGCFKTAIVIRNRLQANIVTNIFKSNAEIFTDIDSAKEWLNDCQQL